MRGTNFDLSNQLCKFYINQHFRLIDSTIEVELYCCPQDGAFRGVEFRPKVYINSRNCMERPRIFNDCRIFHPNINILTCELVSRELMVEWNPTVE